MRTPPPLPNTVILPESQFEQLFGSAQLYELDKYFKMKEGSIGDPDSGCGTHDILP